MTMREPWICSSCQGSNEGRWTVCEGCGAERASKVGAEGKSKKRAACDCGAKLFASGLCSATGGYPATSSCPLACPICRGLLAWDGGCERCHGCTSGKREDWTFPGDRYDLDKGHWQKVDGPRKACTPEQNAAGFAAIRAVLGKAEYLSAGRATIPSIDPAIREKLKGAPR